MTKAAIDFMILQAMMLEANLEEWDRELAHEFVTARLTMARRLRGELECMRDWLQTGGTPT